MENDRFVRPAQHLPVTETRGQLVIFSDEGVGPTSQDFYFKVKNINHVAKYVRPPYVNNIYGICHLGFFHDSRFRSFSSLDVSNQDTD
jgi:hypothetical protein